MNIQCNVVLLRDGVEATRDRVGVGSDWAAEHLVTGLRRRGIR